MGINVQEKLKTKISPETIDLVYHIIEWLYFVPKSQYNNMPYSKDELLSAMNGLRQKKVAARIHKDIKERDNM